MQRLGYIHNMMDVKVLILFASSRSNYPMSLQEIYEVCYQDDCLSYFDVFTALPQMITSGHIEQLEDGKYAITEKGRQDGAMTEDSLAFTVKQRVEEAVERFNRQLRRSSYVSIQVQPRKGEEHSAIVSLDDEKGNLMTLELMAPDRRQAVRLSKLMEEKAEEVYKLTMQLLLDDEDALEDS